MSSSESGRVGAITLDQLIALNDEMAALARAGVPLDRGLLAVGRELRGRTGKFADPSTSPWPSLLLLDLNMPRMDGRDVMERLKADPKYALIRVIVMTTSKAEEDILRSYQLAAASYITKPVTFDSLVQIVQTLGRYWFEIVELPDHDAKRAP